MAMNLLIYLQKRLNGHRNVVSYIDSHASKLPNGTYEVYLLMEYCQGKYLHAKITLALTENFII